jgi:hypothetical protein
LREGAFEVVRLGELEKVIERGLSSFCEVGNALMEIRDQRFYKKTHSTFEAYCKERWGMTKNYANRLISGAKVAEGLVPVGTVPASERQVRPLTALPKEKQAEAWREAVEVAPNGKVTAKHVQQVVDKIEARKAKRRLPKYKEPKNGWVLGSQAMNHAGSAILQLERIDKMDPMRREAFKRVIDWINSQLAEGGDDLG